MPDNLLRQFIWRKQEITAAALVKDPPGLSVSETPRAQAGGLSDR
jgi:hypothetical protein